MTYTPSDAQQKIESFNNNLREQYRQHSAPASTSATTQQPAENKNTFDKLVSFLTNDDIIILGLILLLLFEENKDYLLIGVLAFLLLSSR